MSYGPAVTNVRRHKAQGAEYDARRIVRYVASCPSPPTPDEISEKLRLEGDPDLVWRVVLQSEELEVIWRHGEPHIGHHQAHRHIMED